MADKYNEDVDGGIEDWAQKNKGKKVDEETKQVVEEKVSGKGVAAGKITKEHMHQLDDHIGSIHHEHKEEDPFNRSYGKAATNMFSDLGTAQQDDFFWKNHQTREKRGGQQVSETMPETQIKAPAPIPEETQPEAPSKSKKEIVDELKILDAEIKALIDDIDNNFSLSKNDIKVKRKDLHKLQSRRNKLSNELAE